MKLEGLSRKQWRIQVHEKDGPSDTYFPFEHIAYAHSVTET